jgi:hypothetical protein
MPKSGIWGRKNFVLAAKNVVDSWNGRNKGAKLPG